MAKIYQNRGGTLTPILDTDKFVNVDNVNQSIAGTKTFSGTVNVPDQTVGDYSQKAANTKFVQDTVTNLVSCREETYTAPAGGIPENTNITIPSSQKYIVGSKMLEVYYNGLIEYRGDQYDEVGTVNTESGTITIKHAMEEGDKLVFRINGLCDADSVSDAVHITGTETITGTKTFAVSPNVPTVTDISDSSTKIASTKFVHDLVDGLVTCVDEVLDITTAQASGSLVTLPQGLQYIVGSNALMVSYNGAVCHHGEQFNEYGTTGQLSNQIQILFDLSVGDQLGFRIQGLNRIDDSTDVVHQSGAETITGTKTFNVSPVLPEMAMSTNDRTAASTEFVHDMVDGFMMCYDEVMTVSTAVTSGSNITLPAGMQYVVGSHMLMMSYNGTVCHIGEQFNEVGTTGQNSSTIQVLFDLRVGDKLGFRLHGISEAVQIPYDVVHTSGSETISGVKSFNSSPVVPSPNLGDYSNNVVTSKWVKDLSAAEIYIDTSVASSGDGFTAATAVKTISEGIALLQTLPATNGFPVLISIAGGTYTENVTITNANCVINLVGNVTINGGIHLSESNILIQPNASSTSLTINSSGIDSILVERNSHVIINSFLNISAENTDHAIYAHYSSEIILNRSVDITGNNITTAATRSTVFSHIAFGGSLNIHGSSIKCGILTNEEGYTYIGGDLITSDCITSVFIRCSDHGRVWITASHTLVFYGPIILQADTYGYIIISNPTSLTMTRTGNGDMITAFSYGYIEMSISNVTINAGNYTYAAILSVRIRGMIRFAGSGKITFSGENGTTVYTNTYGHFYLDSHITFGGSITGKRYNLQNFSTIETAGGGASRIPGTIAGTTSGTVLYT